jgi:hypothetical protein
MGVGEVVAALPAAVRQRLQDRGLGAGELDRVLGWPDEDGMLLAGSLVHDLATDASDLDFVLLREVAEPVIRLADQRGLPAGDVYSSTFIDRILTQLNGLELDVWLVGADKAAGLAAVLATAVDDEGAIRSLPGLQYLEIKLLARIYEGTILQGHETVRRWRRWLRVDRLPVLLTVSLLVDALSLLEDAVSVAAPPEQGGLGSTIAGRIAARSAAERLVHAALTSVGIIGWDLRYAPLHREQLRQQGRRPPAAVSALEPLLFPAPPSPTDAGVEPYIELVMDHVARLVEELRRLPDMGLVLTFLRTFGRGRWQLDTRGLGLTD